MASIQITDHELHLKLAAFDSLIALRRQVVVPLGRVIGVRPRPPEADFDAFVLDRSDGRGLLIAGRIAMGTLRLSDGFSFFAVRDPARTIAVDLDSTYELRHLIVELDNDSPEHACRWIGENLDRFEAHGTSRKIA